MNRGGVLFLIGCLLATAASAQTVRLYSELQRVDPFGQVVAPDRGAPPREILSPRVARGAFSSFLVAIRPPQRGPVTIHVGQNPENTLRCTLYKAAFSQGLKGWIPDRLDPVPQPYVFELPASATVPGQTAVVLWLDVWVPPLAPPGRMRLEVQMNWADRWIIAPTEVRIEDPVVPKVTMGALELPPVNQPLDAVVFSEWRNRFCRSKQSGNPTEAAAQTIRGMVARNAAQDIAWAGKRRISEARISENLCSGNRPPGATGPEWYLRLRTDLWQ